jgi:hypothetical protein
VIHGDPAWLPSGGHVRGARQFDGVDDVCVFAGALEADEIKALYDGKEPTTIVARPEVSAPTPEGPVQSAVAFASEAAAATEPNTKIQPVSGQPTATRTSSRGGKNGAMVVIVIAVVGAVAGASFFMKSPETQENPTWLG